VGHTVQFAVSEDVVVDGVIIISKGTPASGVVTYVRKAIRGQLDGRLVIQPVSLTLPDGSSVPLHEARYSDPEARGISGVVLFIAALPFVFSDMAKRRHPDPESGDDLTLPFCGQWYGATKKRVRINPAVSAQTQPTYHTVYIDFICPTRTR
jgi:hypothetical protein